MASNTSGKSETGSVAPADVNELLKNWIATAVAYAAAHRKEAIALKRRHFQFGAPSIILSAIVGTSIFAAIQEAAQSFALKSLLAVLSMIAAALAALVTFYSFSERAAAHRIASEEYDSVARRLQVLITSIATMAPKDWRNILDGYSQTLEAIGHRADLPATMLTLKRVVHTSFGSRADPAGDHVVFEPGPKIPRQGFPEELERVFHLASNEH